MTTMKHWFWDDMVSRHCDVCLRYSSCSERDRAEGRLALLWSDCQASEGGQVRLPDMQAIHSMNDFVGRWLLLLIIERNETRSGLRRLRSRRCSSSLGLSTRSSTAGSRRPRLPPRLGHCQLQVCFLIASACLW